MKPSATKMTYDEYCLLPEDRNQYELFDGELVMTPSPKPRHQEIVSLLTTALNNYVVGKSAGKVYVAPLDVRFTEHTVLQPDILFVSSGRLDIVGEDKVEGAPDLVVEILSPTTFYNDLRRKMAVYSQFRVKEYWIVDPETRTMELYQRSGEGLQLARRFSSSAIFESPLLTGFRFPVGHLF